MLCLALKVSDAHDSTMTGDHQAASATETRDNNHSLRHTPCFMDDVYAALREGVGSDGELTNSSLTLLGVCTGSDSGSFISELAQNQSLEVLHPTGARLEEEGEGLLELTFDLPQSPLLKGNSVLLLLVFESPLTGGNLEVTFTSLSLQPDTQSVCISGETRYILLTGKPSQGNIHWRISVDTKSPDMNGPLKDLLIGGKSGSSIRVTPLLLLTGERGTDARSMHAYTSPWTSSFLCELKHFLGDVMPHDHVGSPQLHLTSLPSLPPLTLGLSSSETLLAGLINSSALTVFSFSGCCSTFRSFRPGELALSSPLRDELGQRLEETAMKMTEMIREEELGHRAMERLRSLKQLSAFPKDEPPTGESQYCAFLLLKALQTVAHTYEVKRALRTTRADTNTATGGNVCGLRSLTVSLEKYLVAPNTAAINNCHGSCAVPLANPSIHAILLNSHIESMRAAGHTVDERAPCCVPVAFESIEVVDFSKEATHLRPFENAVVRECGCR